MPKEHETLELETEADMSLVGWVYDVGSVRLEVVTTGVEAAGTLDEMQATYAPRSPAPPTQHHPNQDERHP